MIQQVLMQVLRQSLNLLFPPQCGLCREMVGENGGVCSDCWQKLNFISAPFCSHCGYPHEFDMGQGAQCAACMETTPEYHGHRSVLHFDDASKRLIHDLKYYDKPLMLDTFARWMAQASPEWIDLDEALLVPVPIHRWRLLKRKYNQSALLAKRLASLQEMHVGYNILTRIKNNPPQASLPRKERLKNLSGAFAVNPKKREAIKGRTIILIDDVMTTGATINACAKQLKKAGSGRVYCLTLARTVLD
ncbi:MAG: ComF family protein [Rickettsiales bacterium]|nr:ComF family protein [Rickettsiales bacterium]